MPYNNPRDKKEEVSAYDRLKNFEANPVNREVIQMYKTWVGYDSKTAQRAYKEWNEYYQKARSGDQGRIFEDMGQAMKSGRLGDVQELKQLSKQIREEGTTIPKPKLIDPYFINNDGKAWQYKNLIRDAKAEMDKQTIYLPPSILGDFEKGGTQ